MKFRTVRAEKKNYGIGIGFALTVGNASRREVEDFINELADKVQEFTDGHKLPASEVAYDFKTVGVVSNDLAVTNELTPRVTFKNAIAGEDEAEGNVTKFDSTPTTEF